MEAVIKTEKPNAGDCDTKANCWNIVPAHSANKHSSSFDHKDTNCDTRNDTADDGILDLSPKSKQQEKQEDTMDQSDASNYIDLSPSNDNLIKQEESDAPLNLVVKTEKIKSESDNSGDSLDNDKKDVKPSNCGSDGMSFSPRTMVKTELSSPSQSPTQGHLPQSHFTSAPEYIHLQLNDHIYYGQLVKNASSSSGASMLSHQASELEYLHRLQQHSLSPHQSSYHDYMHFNNKQQLQQQHHPFVIKPVLNQPHDSFPFYRFNDDSSMTVDSTSSPSDEIVSSSVNRHTALNRNNNSLLYHHPSERYPGAMMAAHTKSRFTGEDIISQWSDRSLCSGSNGKMSDSLSSSPHRQGALSGHMKGSPYKSADINKAKTKVSYYEPSKGIVHYEFEA